MPAEVYDQKQCGKAITTDHAPAIHDTILVEVVLLVSLGVRTERVTSFHRSLKEMLSMGQVGPVPENGLSIGGVRAMGTFLIA